MTGVDLRPLSLGEILDRTFSLYRRHFLLFVGLVGVPRLIVLAFGLIEIFVFGGVADHRGRTVYSHAGTVATFTVLPTLLFAVLVYLISEGGTVLAISEIYLGRTTSISKSLRQVLREFWPLFGVVLLSGLATIGAGLLLIIPGIYVACRLIVCIPVALIERRGPRESLSRSFDLTRDNAFRAFVIGVVFYLITIGLSLLLAAPLGWVAATSKDTGTLRVLPVLTQIVDWIVGVLSVPILTIASAIFYYDLRVRKEGFDLQFMLDPTSEGIARGSGSVPSILS